MTSTGPTTSLWMATAPRQDFPALDADAATDVCVVGAGIAGLTTAYFLAREGLRVLVLDAGAVGHGDLGQTPRTTAHLTWALDDRYHWLEKVHGAEGARLAGQSHREAVDLVEHIVQEEKIACGFERVPGFLFVPPGGDRSELDKELAALQRLGFHEVERVEHTPFAGLLPEALVPGPMLVFPNQGQLHPVKYLNGLAAAVRRLGGRICAGTRVLEVDRDPGPVVRTALGHTVRASAVVVATNTPINDRFAIHTKQAAYRTYVLGFRIPRESYPPCLLWDTPDPYHYIRIERAADAGLDSDVLVVGGEDHKTGQEPEPEQRFSCLEAWARERFPMIPRGPEAVLWRWSGQVMEPVDGLAYIGRNPGDRGQVFIVTGDSGNGMTHGTLAGRLLADLVRNRPNAWEQVYDPGRFHLRALGEYARENANVVAQYADWVEPGDVRGEAEIAPGEGAVLRDGLGLVAAYRDEDGLLHRCEATCPHLGCAVQWNGVERSWDCPCHGSRFTPLGQVLEGPATHSLKVLPAGSRVKG